MEYKTALLIGRFQPFHKGHLYLIKKALEMNDRLVIGIGSANIHDDNNPLDFDTRRKIISAVAYKEKIKDKFAKIVALDDFFNDEKWLVNVKKKAGNFDVVIGNNEWTNKIMEKAGYRVRRFPYYKRQLYEGWRIRKLIREGKRWQSRVPGYLVDYLSSLKLHLPKVFNHAVVGGTFDRFHKGHEKLIEIAAQNAKKITIGIATEELYKDKLFAKQIEPFNYRKNNVGDFLKKNGWHEKSKLIGFSEFTGGADKNDEIDAIVVSRQTYQNALKINNLREKRGLTPLRIIIVDDVLASDGQLLSSERIRLGETDRKGKTFFINSNKDLILPESLRIELRRPLGRVYKSTDGVLKLVNGSVNKPAMIIAVGDVIVKSLLEKGIDPDVKIIDFRSRRKEFSISNFRFSWTFQLPKEKFLNKPGTINIKTTEKLKEIIYKVIQQSQVHLTGGLREKGWLVIDGEEDLLTLPAILYAPLGSLVLYGHWQFGVIAVEVTEKSKEKIAGILLKFS